MRKKMLPGVVLAVVLAVAPAFGRDLRGTVRDTTGAVVASATVELTGIRYSSSQETASDGTFSFSDVPSGRLQLRVRATGFSEKSLSVDATSEEVAVSLVPATTTQNIVVTATRTELPEQFVAADVRVIGLPEITNSAGELTDQVLEQALGFSLFRRSDARIANPTAQGVSLRGMGGSGASRALVLRDGVPLNDPFGGWVQWARVPKIALRDIEIARGGVSDLYGGNAMSGVIDLKSERPAQPIFLAEIAGGNFTQPDLSFFAGGKLKSWQSSAAVETFHSPGYIPVSLADRGMVDRPLSLDFSNGAVFLGHDLGSHGRIFVEPTVFYEDRGNGTALQMNRTQLGQVVLGADVTSATWGTFGFRADATGERYHQSFSSIALDRDSETLSRLQIVPSLQTGTGLQWDRALGHRNHLAAGFDWRRTRGHTEETAFFAGSASSLLDAGGTINNLGGFLEDYLHVGRRLLLSAAVRGDRWNNDDGISTTTPLKTLKPATTFFAGRSESAISPRLAGRLQASDRIAFTASVYRSFRPPTLNELYRSFRLGNILTLANPDLTAEHLTGGEGGAEWRVASTFRVKTEFFWAQVEGPIANTTLKVTPALITRQRTNLGTTRARGTELEGDWRWRDLVLRAGYQWTDSTVISNPQQPALVGLEVPQVPAHQWTLSSEYGKGGWGFGMQARGSGIQFEDDQNLLPLDRYGTVNARVSRRLASGVTAFVVLENLFDQQVMTGRTPIPTFGPPLTVAAGLRLQLGRR